MPTKDDVAEDIDLSQFTIKVPSGEMSEFLTSVGYSPLQLHVTKSLACIVVCCICNTCYAVGFSNKFDQPLIRKGG